MWSTTASRRVARARGRPNPAAPAPPPPPPPPRPCESRVVLAAGGRAAEDQDDVRHRGAAHEDEVLHGARVRPGEAVHDLPPRLLSPLRHRRLRRILARDAAEMQPRRSRDVQPRDRRGSLSDTDARDAAEAQPRDGVRRTGGRSVAARGNGQLAPSSAHLGYGSAMARLYLGCVSRCRYVEPGAGRASSRLCYACECKEEAP